MLIRSPSRDGSATYELFCDAAHGRGELPDSSASRMPTTISDMAVWI